ncbi:Putative porin [Saccharicrinis carchari]|uniref:Porin n=1 Tax=Saccharicrinis carchari TaxID=1168039 RepID=A0A521ADC0_SACCC|nr:putative porin [Saccharicrinis carchari]SMO32814.1 Putative porin [Saccharicrinis carchari]
MSRRWTYIVFLLTLTVQLTGQRGLGSQGTRAEEEIRTLEVDPADRLRSWRLVDDFTRADSLDIDTVTAGVQQYNRIYKKSFSNIYLGNIGSAYTSNLLSFKKDFNEFIFLNSLYDYFVQPCDIRFYNSKVPYTNLTYIYGGPKRRSEENVSVLFTQNVNRSLNLGFNYDLLSSVGSYSAQQTDNRNFNFWMSYNGAKYSVHGLFAYNKANHYLNGGIENDDHELILNPASDEFKEAENVRIKYDSQTNYVDNFQFFITQELGIGKISINQKEEPLKGDSIEANGNEKEVLEPMQLPVGTAYHTLHISSYKRVFKIDNLSNYLTTNSNGDASLPLYGTQFFDSALTRDTTKYTNIKNVFQLKFNEEANALLKFGLRAFVSNEIKHYKYQVEPGFTTVDEVEIPIYRSNDTTFVSTHIGAQLFKNIGRNFWWNMGGKLYVQGYKAGDIQLQGNINTLYKVFKDTAGVYARGQIDLRQAEFLQENYHSNHFQWNRNFKQEKIVNIAAGLNIPTRSLKIAFESNSLTDYLYWNEEAVPDQTSELINAFELSLYKKFKLGPLHSHNKLAYQYSSNQKLYPLPDFAGLSSNYFDFYLAKRVLNVQIGVDVKYHTEYYTPAYMPATGQFYLQNKMKIGNYPFLDAFMNLQLKRARIFVKLDHFNQSFMNRNYFLTVGYPHSPMRFKWGVSWNFYD